MDRRLTTVLAADVVGYSALMDADRTGTLAALRKFRDEVFTPALEAHSGTLIKSLGDGWIVEFRGISDAADFAIALQDSLPANDPIKLRIGIHTGEVIAEDGDVFGDGINIAARLEALAEPRQILISDTAHNSLDRTGASRFAGGKQRQLKNIARPVTIWHWPAETSLADAETRDDRPGIAVLPFDNLSGDAEQEYFADGITEDIITELSRFRWLMVVARNSTFTYKGKSTDIREVGSALGVRYVLEGSVRRSGNRVRITGQLIDAQDGSHLWADKFDGVLDDIFDLQDQVTRDVVGAIEPSLRNAEVTRARRKPTDDMAAYELYLQAQAHFHLATEDDNREAIRFAGLALARDPGYTNAAGLLAWLHLQRVVQRWETIGEGAAEAVRLAEQVLRSDNADGIAIAYAAHAIHQFTGDAARSQRAFERSLEENPYSSIGHMLYGCNLPAFGAPEKALEHLDFSMKLSPRDPFRYGALSGKGLALFQLGRYEEAVVAARGVLAERPMFILGHYTLIAALAQSGDADAARAAAKDLLEIQPGVTISSTLKQTLFFSRSGSVEQFCEGWRIAGIPD